MFIALTCFERLITGIRGGHARRRVDGDPGQLVTQNLALAGVQPGAHLDTKGSCLSNECVGASNRPRRSIKRGQESIAGGPGA